MFPLSTLIRMKPKTRNSELATWKTNGTIFERTREEKISGIYRIFGKFRPSGKPNDLNLKIRKQLPL